MKTVDRYIGQNVMGATLTVLFVLLAIFTFFSFIDELEEIGKGSYSLGGASAVVALRLPGLIYELFPIAALIGALLGLGGMMAPFSTSCADHTGHSGGWMIEWDGEKFVQASDLLSADRAAIEPLEAEKAAEYAAANAPWPMNEACEG